MFIKDNLGRKEKKERQKERELLITYITSWMFYFTVDVYIIYILSVEGTSEVKEIKELLICLILFKKNTKKQVSKWVNKSFRNYCHTRRNSTTNI